MASRISGSDWGLSLGDILRLRGGKYGDTITIWFKKWLTAQRSRINSHKYLERGRERGEIDIKGKTDFSV